MFLHPKIVITIMSKKSKTEKEWKQTKMNYRE